MYGIRYGRVSMKIGNTGLGTTKKHIFLATYHVCPHIPTGGHSLTKNVKRCQ